jgi:hypothetical protein
MRTAHKGIIAAGLAVVAVVGSFAQAGRAVLGVPGIGTLPAPVPLFNPSYRSMNDAAVRAIYETQLEVYAVQRTLSQRIMNSTAIVEARRDVRLAYRAYNAARENALVPLRDTEYYKSLQGQLWKGDTVVTALHGYVPPDQRKILARSVDNLALRKAITELELGILDNDEQVLISRTELNGALRRYLGVLKQAADELKNDPQMVDATRRLRAARGSLTGR